MQPLTAEALRKILTEPKNAIVKQYEQLFAMDGVDFKFSDEVLDYIVEKADEYKLGARGLRSICEAIVTDIMFDLPSSDEKAYILELDYAKKRIEGSNFLQLKQVG
jgi:ATP-dependent Clp protease ATP-binding subunit ClpX